MNIVSYLFLPAYVHWEDSNLLPKEQRPKRAAILLFRHFFWINRVSYISEEMIRILRMLPRKQLRYKEHLSNYCSFTMIEWTLFTIPTIFARALRLIWMVAGANKYRGQVCLFSQNKRTFLVFSKCIVRVSTSFTSLLLPVRTSTVATASKKVNNW